MAHGAVLDFCYIKQGYPLLTFLASNITRSMLSLGLILPGDGVSTTRGTLIRV
ncbi:hypothetical protein DR76_4937 (plasmid) [Escherichia coli ATCC 25922]|nr:hypothetical protein DR76_4937 [Escherichia coli ATCC 25922]